MTEKQFWEKYIQAYAFHKKKKHVSMFQKPQENDIISKIPLEQEKQDQGK